MKLEYSVEHPLNREPAVKYLIRSFITENGAYERNHGPIPHIDAESHVVRVDGAVNDTLELSIQALRSQYIQHEVVCALQCAGNRRHSMRTLLKEVDGIDWGDGAVMNCMWKGPKLRDILNRAGVNLLDLEKGHVAFACYKTQVQDDDWYGGSIKLERALQDNADVLLALEMNGKPLSANHGYPVRVVVPGVSGCRSVKWLDRITVQTQESSNFYQQRDYKILPPEATDKHIAEKYWSTAPAIQDMPVNCVIAVPQNGDTVTLSPKGTFEVEGYALPQGDKGPVVKVEISIDGGETWEDAAIDGCCKGKGKWCWVLWRLIVHLKKGDKQRILSRATDAGGNTQPANPSWNLRGVGYNGYGESRDLRVQ